MDKKICFAGRSGKTGITVMKATLSIKTEFKNGSTVLKQAYYTPPYKIANITEDKKSGPLRLMLMSSSPGILDGDSTAIKIELEEGSSLYLQTQSFQRLFQMQREARQTLEVDLKERASFYYLPHPLVPHKNSNFIATNQIFLSRNCTLFWGEIITSGRNLNGENFLFSKLQSKTQIFLENKLVVKENLLLMPGSMDIRGLGNLEGFTHQASLVFMREGTDINELIAETNSYLEGEEALLFGCTKLPVNGLLLRILGYKGEQLYHCLKTMASLIEKRLNKKILYE